MKRFGEIYKQKLNEAESRKENKILEDFKSVYNSMLDHYNLRSIHQLDEESQVSFLSELNNYWSEEEGLSKKGQIFIDKHTMELNENSTAIQKRNFLREKSHSVINETLRRANIKYKLYDVIDEMYTQLNASDINDILSPDTIISIINESFVKSLDELMSNVTEELKGSAKPKTKYYVRVNSSKLNERDFSEKKRKELAKEGKAMPDGSYPIVNKNDLKNAIKAFGRTGEDKAATKKHIKKRARALGATDILPEHW